LSQFCELGFVLLLTRLSSETQEKDCYQEEVYKVLHCSADSKTDGLSMQKHLRNIGRWMSDFYHRSSISDPGINQLSEGCKYCFALLANQAFCLPNQKSQQAV